MTHITRTPLRRLCAPLGVIAVLALAGCADVPDLMKFPNKRNTPNEFTVIPSRPLATPPAGAALPVPQSNAVNLATPSPIDSAIVALGGTTAAANRTGIPASDTALLATTTRYGTEANIRDVLAAEDIDYRRHNRPQVLAYISGTNWYFTAYNAMSLDQRHEMERLRAIGVRVPVSPPPIPVAEDN